MTRTPIAKAGRYGATVNVFAMELDGEPVARVEWREQGERKTRTFRGTKRDRETAAKAFADGKAYALQGHTAPKPTRLTVGELWERYVLAHEADWRPKSLILNKSRWRVFTLHVSPSTFADLVQPETLDSWRLALLTTNTKRGEPMARNQVAHHIQLVKSVWRFARARKLLAENALADYAVRKGKDYKPRDVPEFTGEQWAAILQQFDYTKTLQWRAWAAIALDGLLATRSNALLRLEWSHITGRTVTWSAKTDKVGNQRVQPLPRDAVFVLRVCKVWARRDGYTGPYVFYSPHPRKRANPWTYSALNQALHAGCDRAGVERVPFKAMHGFRRMAAGNVLEQTGGDLVKVGDWLGDTDLGVLKQSYVKKRAGHLESVAAASTLPTRDTTGNQLATARKTRPTARSAT